MTALNKLQRLDGFGDTGPKKKMQGTDELGRWQFLYRELLLEPWSLRSVQFLGKFVARRIDHYVARI